MPHLEQWASRFPHKTAYAFPQSDEQVSYGALHRRSLALAWWLIEQGLQPGDHIAVLMENRPELLEIAWGAIRAGLYYTVIGTHLHPREVAYILENSECRLLIVSGRQAETAMAALDLTAVRNLACYAVEGAGWLRFPELAGEVATAESYEELPRRSLGRDLLYSSGTTGQPKGVSRELIPYEERHILETGIALWQQVFGFDGDTVYLSPAPLYHAAPLRFCMQTMKLGGTAVVMRRFEPAEALRLIEAYRATHSQWVPTMFVRMLDLPEAERRRHDVSSMQVAIHAAAPCPVHVKDRMIESKEQRKQRTRNNEQGHPQLGAGPRVSKGWLEVGSVEGLVLR